jgi:TonB family protein
LFGPAESTDFVPEEGEFHLVILKELQDDLVRARRREAFWISVVVHILVFIALATMPRWMPVHLSRTVSAEDLLKDNTLTYLANPADRSRSLAQSHNAKLASDRNRVATSHAPQIDPATLERLRALAAAQAATQQPPSQQPAGGQPAASAPPSSPLTPFPNTNPNAYQAPPQQARTNPFAQPMTASSAISQAARGTAHGGGGGFGEIGPGPGGGGSHMGNGLEILSDTQGVDFDPYIRRVLDNIRTNWYTLCPESVNAPLRKHGKVKIEFAILPDGKVAGMRLSPDGTSGDAALDRAAWGGISLSNPFPPLPSEFHGPYLALRIHFFYNPERGEMEGDR